MDWIYRIGYGQTHCGWRLRRRCESVLLILPDDCFRSRLEGNSFCRRKMGEQKKGNEELEMAERDHDWEKKPRRPREVYVKLRRTVGFRAGGCGENADRSGLEEKEVNLYSVKMDLVALRRWCDAGGPAIVVPSARPLPEVRFRVQKRANASHFSEHRMIQQNYR